MAFLLGWAIFRITDWLSPPQPVGLTLVRPVDPDRDHIRGRPDAPLTLVEEGDLECPFCRRATGSIDQVRDHFGDRLRYVWRHLPLERVHPRAFDAARASEAAAQQGRFWEMAIEMFAHPDDLEWSDIYRYAVRPPQNHLWRNPKRRSAYLQPRLCHVRRQAKVNQLHFCIHRHHDVGCLQIAMSNLPLVHERKRLQRANQNHAHERLTLLQYR